MMTKNAIPGMKPSSALMFTVAGAVAVLVVLVLVITHPGDAAHFVRAVFGWTDRVPPFCGSLATSLRGCSPLRHWMTVSRFRLPGIA